MGLIVFFNVLPDVQIPSLLILVAFLFVVPGQNLGRGEH